MSIRTETVVGSGLLPRVNLLPPEIAEQRRFRQVQIGMATLVAAAVGGVAALAWASHHAVNSAQQQVAAAQTRNADLQAQLTKLDYVKQTYDQVAEEREQLVTALSPEILWSHYLNDLSLTIPENVWLTQMTASETAAGGGQTSSSSTSGQSGTTTLTPTGLGTVQFTGVAFDHDDVANWLDSLAKENGYLDPYFSSSTEAKIGTQVVVDFQSSVTLGSGALSNRVLQMAGG